MSRRPPPSGFGAWVRALPLWSKIAVPIVVVLVIAGGIAVFAGGGDSTDSVRSAPEASVTTTNGARAATTTTVRPTTTTTLAPTTTTAAPTTTTAGTTGGSTTAASSQQPSVVEDPQTAESAGGGIGEAYARGLAAQGAKVVVAENPTRGLDIRATAAVHERLRRAAADGAAVLFHSNDLDEVLGLATRVLVASRGSLIEPPADSTRDAVGALMAQATAAQLALWRSDAARPPLVYVRPKVERAATFRMDRVRQYASDGYAATREALAGRP